MALPKIRADTDFGDFRLLRVAPFMGVPVIQSIASGDGTTEKVIARWPVPANTLTVAMARVFEVWGAIDATSTVRFRARFGTTGTISDTLIASANTMSGSAADLWGVSGSLYTFGVGASGSAAVYGRGTRNSTALNFSPTGGTPVGIDTTVDSFFSICLNHGTAANSTVRIGQAGRWV